jgi:hypothetical protein
MGLIGAWVFNSIANARGENYLSACFGSPVDWVLSLDLLIFAVAGSAFMITEARDGEGIAVHGALRHNRVCFYFSSFSRDSRAEVTGDASGPSRLNSARYLSP